jgi:hypothetical protein
MAQGSTALRPVGHQVAYLRKRIDAGDTADASVTRYTMGKVPLGSNIINCTVAIKTGFSAAGTRVLTVGSNGTTANNIFASALTEETATAVVSIIGAKLSFSSDTTIYAKLTTAGTAAAAGQAEVTVAFVPAQEDL